MKSTTSLLPMSNIWGKTGAYSSGATHKPKNITPGWKYVEATNTLAYNMIIAIKSVIVLAPGATKIIQ